MKICCARSREVSGVSTPLLFAAGDPQHSSDLGTRLRNDHAAAERCRALQSARRRRRDSRRRSAQARLDEMHDRRMARRDARRSRVGLRSTATMMFGIGDRIEHRVRHLQRVRDLQDETGGFYGVYPVDVSAREHRARPQIKEEPTGIDYLKMLAVSRSFSITSKTFNRRGSRRDCSSARSRCASARMTWARS